VVLIPSALTVSTHNSHIYPSLHISALEGNFEVRNSQNITLLKFRQRLRLQYRRSIIDTYHPVIPLWTITKLPYLWMTHIRVHC